MVKTSSQAEHYDVVILGAGMSGLSCAQALVDSDLKVLLIEKSVHCFEKVCAAGITHKDLSFIPRRYIIHDYSQVRIKYGDDSLLTSVPDGLIASIDRQKFLRETYENIRKCPNVSVLIPETITQLSNGEMTLRSGKKISFTYLVGADGSNSIVRSYLRIPTTKIGLALQYIVPVKAKEFVIRLDEEMGRYYWIFPYINSSSVGCGGSLSYISPKRLREKADWWMKTNGFNASQSQLQAALINFDYRGYQFGNTFLAGDASGLTSGLTGKGIYPALFMGRYIADKIRDIPTDDKTFRKMLLKKKLMEGVGLICESSMRKLFMHAGERILMTAFGQSCLSRVID